MPGGSWWLVAMKSDWAHFPKAHLGSLMLQPSHGPPGRRARPQRATPSQGDAPVPIPHPSKPGCTRHPCGGGAGAGLWPLGPLRPHALPLAHDQLLSLPVPLLTVLFLSPFFFLPCFLPSFLSILKAIQDILIFDQWYVSVHSSETPRPFYPDTTQGLHHT